MKHYAFLLLGASALNCYAQPTFQKTIGGGSDDYGNSIIHTSDGGYAVCGRTASFGAGLDDVYITKLDSSGNLQWTKTIGGSGQDGGSSIIQSSDGGYAVAGTSNSFGAGSVDVYIVKLDGSGNLQWTKTIGGSDEEWALSIINTNDGGYAVGAWTRSFGAGGYDVYVVKLDGSGNLQWTKSVGGTGADDCGSIIQTSDGGYAIGGYTNSFNVGSGYGVVYVVKLNSSGNLQWTKSIGGNGGGGRGRVIQTNDEGYAISSATSSFGAGGYDVYVSKLDSSGNLQWTKTIGGNSDEFGFSIIQTTDGKYVVTGSTNSFGAGNDDVYVVKLDGNGNLQWTKTIGGSGDERGISIIETSDGGYTVGGYTNSFGAGSNDVYVVKLDSTGNTCGNVGTGGTVSSGGAVSSGGTTSSGGTVNSGGAVSSGGTVTDACSPTGADEIAEESSISVFPNPTSGIFQIQGFKLKVQNFEIYNVMGEKICSSSVIGHQSSFIDISSYPSGIYFMKVKNTEEIFTRKIIVQK